MAAESPPYEISHFQAGYYHFKIGEIEVIALSDGTLPIPVDKLLTNVRTGEVASRLAYTYQGTDVEASINAFLIKAGDRLIMVDAGTGELYGPKLNKLGASLKAAGYKQEQITDILITHIHTDHTGGLMDGHRMVFPNATVHVEQKELDYWLNPDHRKQAPESMKKYFDEAFAKVKPYVHVAEVQLPRPDVTILFDVDPKAAAATRKKVLADAAQGGYWIAGDHISFPGVGHVQVDGDGYRWIPITYINDYYE